MSDGIPTLRYHKASATDPDENEDKITLKADGVTIYLDEIEEDGGAGYKVIKSGEVVGYIPEDEVEVSPAVVLSKVRETKEDIPLR